jgi:hypothetical protein
MAIIRPVLTSFTRDQVLQLMKFQDLAAQDGIALVALPAREARALVLAVVNLTRPVPHAAEAARGITEVLEAQGLWT